MGKKVLMYSGGMDSWLIDKLWKPDVKIFVDIGTPGSDEEIKRLPKDVIVKKMPLGEFEEKGGKFLLPLRNLFLVEMGSYFGDEICIGATAESVHYDNNEKFATDTSNLLNYLYSEGGDKKVKVVIPYAHMYKKEILAKYLEEGGSAKEAWEKSFSCYTPVHGKECGCCDSCIQKKQAFLDNGYNFDF